MNLILILILFFFNTLDKLDAKLCTNLHNNRTNFEKIPNKIFEEITLSTVEDLIFNVTQLEIYLKPQKEFSNKKVFIEIISTEEYCYHLTENEFKLDENIITIPPVNLNQKDKILKPGCNYTIILSVEKYCTFSYYKIPEIQPCRHFLQEDVFDTYPNKIIETLNITSFKDNAIRLNISFTPKPEYRNHSGYITINSKMNKCNHPEEFSFKLDETNLTIPRVKYPHSFIDSKCEYFIDFEIDQYCVTTLFKIPDFCYNNEPKIKIIKIIKENNVGIDGIYKILWKIEPTKRNKTYSIIDINYR